MQIPLKKMVPDQQRKSIKDENYSKRCRKGRKKLSIRETNHGRKDKPEREADLGIGTV